MTVMADMRDGGVVTANIPDFLSHLLFGLIYESNDR